MTDKTQYVKCHAISRVSIGTWSDIQESKKSIFSMSFQQQNAMLYLMDAVEEKEIKLHNGLDIIVVF